MCICVKLIDTDEKVNVCEKIESFSKTCDSLRIKLYIVKVTFMEASNTEIHSQVDIRSE